MPVKDPTYIDSLANRMKANLKKGYNRDSLKWAMINQGHSKMEVEKALRQVDADMAREATLEARRRAQMAPPPMITPIEEEMPRKGFFSRLFGV